MERQIIAVPALDNKGEEGLVSGHFGRCPFFTFVYVEDGALAAFETLTNPAAASHRPGEIPKFVKDQGATVILTGGMGGRAIQLFEQWGIEVATGASGNIREAVAAWKGGHLVGAGACAGDEGGHHHH